MKIYGLQFVLLLLCSLYANAQTDYDGISIQNISCQQKGDKVLLIMNVDASKIDISSQEALVITPVIMSPDNKSEFSKIVISGKNRYKVDRRTESFNGQLAYKTPYTVLQNGGNASNIVYESSIPFEPWMVNAEARIKQVLYGCAECKDSLSLLSLTSVRLELTKPQGKPLPNYITPVAEAVKNRKMQGQAYLDFPVGKSIILPNFRNNFQEISKITEAINMLGKNPDAMFNSITLKGFASPEGSYKTNERLSEQRSQALKLYLQKEYNYPDNMFDVSSVAEDWEGFKRLVEASTMSEKQTLLNIIDDSSTYDAKERKLKSMNSLYTKVLQDYFPQLRRVDYKLNYTIRAFSVEEGKEIIKNQPGQMSLNEMFLVANTYAKGGEKFNRVFDVAVRMYPSDPVANINAAAAVLENGDVITAHRFLDPYTEIPASWNNQGVMYMLEEKYDKAASYLNKANSADSTEAKHNLELLKLLMDYTKKKASFDEIQKPKK